MGLETFVEGPLDVIGVGRDPAALAPGEDAIWVAHASDDIVTRIDLDGAVYPIRVDGGASATRGRSGAGLGRELGGAGPSRGSISRQTRSSRRSMLAARKAGIAVDHGLVWIAAQTP